MLLLNLNSHPYGFHGIIKTTSVTLREGLMPACLGTQIADCLLMSL